MTQSENYGHKARESGVGRTGHKAGHRRDGTKAGLGEGLENPGQSRQRPDEDSEVKDEVR